MLCPTCKHVDWGRCLFTCNQCRGNTLSATGKYVHFEESRFAHTANAVNHEQAFEKVSGLDQLLKDLKCILGISVESFQVGVFVGWLRILSISKEFAQKVSHILPPELFRSTGANTLRRGLYLRGPLLLI